MARIITVHGTFAKWEITPAAGDTVGPPVLQWWQPGSAFEKDMRAFVTGDDNPVTIESFEWSSANSERDRRKAADKLLARTQQLEAEGEPYSLVGHSHGGSVISTMLINAAAKNQTLPNLRRWITVGTPFVEMRKEQFLFSRLPLLLKAVYVASLMLMFMFLVATFADIIDGKSPFANRESTIWFLTSLTLTALPFILFYIATTWHQNRALFYYRPGITRKARELFASKWLPLVHEDDEIVKGLSSLNSVKVRFFHENFAVTAVTFVSAFILPLIYLWLLNSPATMVAIADILKTKVYDIKRYETVEPFYKHDRKQIEDTRNRLRTARRRVNDPLADLDERTQRQSEVEILRNDLKNMRQKVRKTYQNNVVQNERARRFKERFLQKPDGTDCRRGQLCRRGNSIRINSRLLFHLVTDEVSRIAVDADIPTGTIKGIINYALPILLVPIIFIGLAIALVKFVQLFAGAISRFASNRLDALTWAQVRRTALGNDTVAEVAVGAIARPYWIKQDPSCLPSQIGEAITTYSNEVTADSLSKFRNAISELAFSDRDTSNESAVLKFFTWRELVHAAYFEVPEFRWLVATALADREGFKPTDALANAPSFAALTECLTELTPPKPDVGARGLIGTIAS